MNLRSQKGINIITLSVAIIILVLITSVLVYSSKDSVKIRNLKDLYNDIEMLDNKIEAYYLEHGDIPKLDQYTNVDFRNTANNEEINPNDGSNYYIVDLEAMDGITLNYGKDYKTIKSSNGTLSTEALNALEDLYIINEASHTIYYPRGVNVQGKRYYTYGEEWKKVDLAVIPIETAEQLAKIGSGDSVSVNGTNYTFSIDGTYVLKNDIDLSSICYKVDGTTEHDKSWIPLCNTEATAFTGKLYGNEHEIRGLYINTMANNQGLFMLNSGLIQDLSVEGNILSENPGVGGISTRNYKKGKIINCNSKVSIKANRLIGGIVGQNYGEISKCKNFKKIEGTIENATNGVVGGIAGHNMDTGVISQSYNEGNIIGKSNCIGGIAGGNYYIINSCVNNGNVFVDCNYRRNSVGGIVGYFPNTDGKIINCYNLKNITNYNDTGGIAGDLVKGQILNCYSIGEIIGTGGNIKSTIGRNWDNNITRNNFYLNTLSTTDENATPKSMADMKSQAFVDLLNTGQLDQPWTMDTMGINDGYPVLKWQMEELK